MANTTSAGINKERINTLCRDIQTYMENVRKTLNTIDDLVDGSVVYYSDDTRNAFLNKKANYKLSHDIISNNIFSYIDDYNAVVTKFVNKDSSFDFDLK